MDNNSTIIDDYAIESKSVIHKLDLILEKIKTIEIKQSVLEYNMFEQIGKNLEIKKYLEENREKYMECLERLNTKDTLVSLLNQTRTVLQENRHLYGQSFDSILLGERQLRDLLMETKKILYSNQEFNEKTLKAVCEHDKINHKNITELKVLLENHNLTKSNKSVNTLLKNHKMI